MFSKLNTLIDAICKEKGVKKEVVIDALENAFISVVKKRMGELGPLASISAQYSPEEDNVLVYQYKKVVADVTETGEDVVLSAVDSITQIKLTDALKEDNEVAVGDELGFLVEENLTQLNRKNIQIFKQILMQKIKDAERRILMDNFSDKKGKIVSGIIKRIDARGNALVDLGAAEAMLYKREMLMGDELSQNSKVNALLVDVSRKGTRGPEIVLSRNNHMFLYRLLEQECPRVEDGTVEIIKMAREGGLRSKVIVRSNDASVNPMSEIIGDSGYRIQSIIDICEGEKINIIPETRDRGELLEISLKPGEIEGFMEYDDHIDVIANEEELGKLIGKRGSNLRAAASIMDKRINIITTEKLSEYKNLAREELKKVESISDLVREELIARHVFTIEHVANQPADVMQEVLGLSEDEANKVIAESKKILSNPSFKSETDDFDLVESYGKPREYPLPETGSSSGSSSDAERRLREELAAFKLK